LTTKIPLTGSLKVQELLTKTVINQNNLKIRDSCNRYRRFYIKGREQDRLKISMPAIPLNKEETEDFKHGNI
jgi:NADH-quinone oxidoreductase subunit G